MSTTKADNSAASRGFDSPVVSRKDDHLNRWPLAREIYDIATTGPKDWSVRIGIYGEWGTGKTSVLKFVSSIATAGGHVVIPFNPWEHSSKESLWCAFVLAIFADPKLATVPGALKARTKGIFGGVLKKAKVVESGTALLNDKLGRGVGAGLELVKTFFSFSQKDLKSLRDALGERRVIVLIDDLDRTAPELVPEILFALKELMDVPGFSFICAFDPTVIGQVLGKYHPGFRDGLKFLDKIIDYPRWLPPASTDNLVGLALAEAKRSCAYVPDAAIRDAIPLLPANPRTVRKFLRLLALLEPQIERHGDDELNWPVILAANILKIRHSRIAHELLGGEGFWNGIGMLWVETHAQEKEQKLDTAVSEEVQKAAASLGLTLDETDKKEIEKSLKAICFHVAAFMGLDPEDVAYQVNVAEAPAAVTRKEFDAFLTHWKSRQVGDTAKKWITDHAQRVDRSELDVYRQLLSTAIRRYAEALHQADNVLAETEKPGFVTQAASLFALLNVLVFDLGSLTQATKQIGDAELALFVDKVVSMVASTRPVHAEFWPRNEAFIVKLFEQWASDVMPLIRVLSPYARRWSQHFNGEQGAELHKKLCGAALPKFGRQAIAAFHEEGFVQRLMQQEEDTFDSRCMIWDAQGPLWGPLRNELFQALSEAHSNRSIQTNAYELLHWFVLGREGHVPGDPKAMQTLFSDQPVFDAVWNAAIASPLAPRGVYQLRELPKMVQPLGIKCEPPPWWQQIVATFTAPAPPPPPADGSTPTPPEEKPQ